MSTIDTANAVVTSLFGVGGLGVAVKWWLDKRKSPLDRNKVLADAAGTNVTSSLAIAAESRAIATEARTIAVEAREEATKYRVGYVEHRRILVGLAEDWPEARQSITVPFNLPREVL